MHLSERRDYYANQIMDRAGGGDTGWTYETLPSDLARAGVDIAIGLDDRLNQVPSETIRNLELYLDVYAHMNPDGTPTSSYRILDGLKEKHLHRFRNILRWYKQNVLR